MNHALDVNVLSTPSTSGDIYVGTITLMTASTYSPITGTFNEQCDYVILSYPQVTSGNVRLDRGSDIAPCYYSNSNGLLMGYPYSETNSYVRFNADGITVSVICAGSIYTVYSFTGYKIA